MICLHCSFEECEWVKKKIVIILYKLSLCRDTFHLHYRVRAHVIGQHPMRDRVLQYETETKAIGRKVKALSVESLKLMCQNDQLEKMYSIKRLCGTQKNIVYHKVLSCLCRDKTKNTGHTYMV